MRCIAVHVGDDVLHFTPQLVIVAALRAKESLETDLSVCRVLSGPEMRGCGNRVLWAVVLFSARKGPEGPIDCLSLGLHCSANCQLPRRRG